MIFVLVVSAAMGGLTWLLGWWGVAVAAAIVGFVFSEYGGGGWRVALAAAIAWGVLLAADGLLGQFGMVGTTLAGVMQVPAAMLVLLTLVFPALVAWSAATLVSDARRLVSGRRRTGTR